MNIKGRTKLVGTVEADEFYIGGEATGGKRGRGAEHKVAVAIAVEKDGKKWGRVRLQVIEACSAGHLIPFIRDNVELGSTVFTDGWSGYKQLGAEGYNHLPEVQPKDQVVGKRFFRLVQQVAGSRKLINTCLAPVSPGLAN